MEDFENEKSPRPLSTATSSSGKRKYKRHPKGDDFAPKKPISAYVRFANDVRDELKPKNFSFAEIAKSVGERWKILDEDTKARYEAAATLAKEEYNRALVAYKQTDQFAQYQRYLVEFKSNSNKDSTDASKKRPKLQTSNLSTTESETLQSSSTTRMNRLLVHQDSTTMTDSPFRSPRASSINSSGSEFGSEVSRTVSETYIQEEVTSSLAQHTISSETSQPSKSTHDGRQSAQSTNQVSKVLNYSDSIVRTSQTQLQETTRSRSHTRSYESPETYHKPETHNQMSFSQVQPVLSHSRGRISPNEPSMSYSQRSPHTTFPSKNVVSYNDPYANPMSRTGHSPSMYTSPTREGGPHEFASKKPASHSLHRSLPPLSTAVPIANIGKGSPYPDRGYTRDQVPVSLPTMSRESEQSSSRKLPALNTGLQRRYYDQEDQDVNMEGNDRMNASF